MSTQHGQRVISAAHLIRSTWKTGDHDKATELLRNAELDVVRWLATGHAGDFELVELVHKELMRRATGDNAR
jgi:hypothetical protein